MTGTIKKILLSASVLAASFSAIATAPASAFSISGSDYLLYDVQGSSTYINPNANLDSILGGNSSAPGGNIELFASSETKTNAQFMASNAVTSVKGTVAGKNLTLSSLTATDWFGAGLNTTYGQNNLANTWFNAFLTNAGKANYVGNVFGSIAFNTFYNIGGFQRSSDPNVSYVTASGTDINIGLAGHYDLKAYYKSNPQFSAFASLLPNGFQASEVVKATIDGQSQYLYSFLATKSGLTNSAGKGADGSSHSGNYEVSLKGVIPPASVPEPSTMLGLMAVGGMVAASKRKANKTA
ncbi:NF038130 family PEP-CTERM protein [Coleofasciculus sp. FACHB-129]|uniref:NF038130 family PEP-CTERM protein n=1 Tax=Cyanophyceae TaxID=3028117 RepID=UPI001688EDDB|nr:NF038130 family PEP-CTERM protein [Coleofasciculus sp. FACHB-129]MBD1893342.1 NF038130 family PEP-CTERM protein [Coleofasciculus sp. FACHB-129]